ncbi:hypothetical protein RHS01_04483 [Rhizoctonia solani]|uniref:Uncharacterized protein n=1 Tax=Rhizoctonia solani TaxID=456999 RepID=A0A8H7IDI3_9AGAM|nr:hypothetical protein RHS01_04483 [Rhizoctonia solani]
MASTSGMRKGKRTSGVLPRVAIRLIIDLTATVDGPYCIPSCVEDSWSHQVWLGLYVARVLTTLRSVSRGWRDPTSTRHGTPCAACSTHTRSTPSPEHTSILPKSRRSRPKRRHIQAHYTRDVSCLCRHLSRHPSLSSTSRKDPTASDLSNSVGNLGSNSGMCNSSSSGILCSVSALRTHNARSLWLPTAHTCPLAANERDIELVRWCDLRTPAGAGVRAVCGACRHERIRTELIRGRGANMAPWMGSGFWDWDYEVSTDVCPLGVRPFQTRYRQIVAQRRDLNQYAEYGDWTIREAIEEMEERVWMRWWTKASEMEGLVRATARLQRMEERAAEPLDTDDESDEEDDLLSLSDEFGLRDMIFQDWARNRILEDINQYHSVPQVPIQNFDTSPRDWHLAIRLAMSNALLRPYPGAWETAMRSIIGPAISNIVARIVKECKFAEEVFQAGTERGIVDPDIEQAQSMGIDVGRAQRVDLESIRSQCVLSRGEPDPCKVVSRIGVDRLVEILRTPEPWVEGGGWEDVYVDWEDANSFRDRDSATPSNFRESIAHGNFRDHGSVTPNNFRDLESANIPREREPSLAPSSVAPTLRESVAPSPPPSTISAQSPPPTLASAQSPRPSTISAPSPTDQRSSPVSTTPSPEALTSPSTMRTTRALRPLSMEKGSSASRRIMKFHNLAPPAYLSHTQETAPSHPARSDLRVLPWPADQGRIGNAMARGDWGVMDVSMHDMYKGDASTGCSECSAAHICRVSTDAEPDVYRKPTDPASASTSASISGRVSSGWNLEPMNVEEPEVEVEVEGKGKGVVGRRSREREDGEERGERKRCKIGVEVA